MSIWDVYVHIYKCITNIPVQGQWYLRKTNDKFICTDHIHILCPLAFVNRNRSFELMIIWIGDNMLRLTWINECLWSIWRLCQFNLDVNSQMRSQWCVGKYHKIFAYKFLLFCSKINYFKFDRICCMLKHFMLF
jgi:hypothetical protein